MVLLAAVPLLLWPVLLVASRRPGWGYVGKQPTEMQVACRVMIPALKRFEANLQDVGTTVATSLAPAFARLNQAFHGIGTET